MDYQKTLNLPKTDFSMRAGLAQKEPNILKSWEAQRLYQNIQKKSKGKKKFILHDGPPYANGHIHIGHALNKILKDIIVKFKTMRGYDSWYVPGWDCHGLPIEHQLFKELKKHKSQVDCVDFRKKAHDYAMKFVGVQREEFKRLGVFGDWDKPYLTLDKDYEYWILKSLASLTKDGYVYRGLKPVNWCFNCETALAEAEVEYEKHTSPSVYVKLKVDDSQEKKPLSLLIWTTTPWTLMANVAVAVHARYTYALIDIGEEIIVIEDSLHASVLEKAGIKNYKVVKKVNGDQLTKFHYTHPFGLKDKCRVVTVDYVTREEGTGLVHTAPGHGQEDFETGLKYKLEVLMPVDHRGVYTKQAGAFAGQHVFKANQGIVEDLKKRNLLLYYEDHPHEYPHCWRCKKPVIFRATEQWFLKIDHKGLRGKLKDAVKKDIRWIPESGQERILGMVTTRPDWCLSRQRYWGVPIPALVCKGCSGEHKLFAEVIESFAQIVKREGTDAWFEKEIKDLLPKGFACPKCKKKEFEKTHDILDVWFDSGVSHQAVVKDMMKMNLPVDLYLEGSDQHRGWFQSSLIPAMAIEKKPPYRGVLTHGFVVDGQGRKMSKSLGNVISPLDIMKHNGADILRLWVASSSYNEDIRISKEILDRLVDAYRKMRNTLRYLLGNLDGYDPQKDELAYTKMEDVDRWALHRLAVTFKEIEQGYDNYDFAKAYKAIYAFCNEDLSSFYLDILKDRMYTSAAKSQKRRSAQTVLYHILDFLVRVMAPLISFTAEETFSFMPKTPATRGVASVHLLDWPKVPAGWLSQAIDKKFEPLMALRPHVMKALEEKRRLKDIGSSLEAKIIFHTASAKDFNYLNGLEAILPAAFIVSQVTINKVKEIQAPVASRFAKTAIEINKADGQKCVRCWNYRPSVGQNKEHPALCGPCAVTLKEIINDGKEVR